MRARHEMVLTETRESGAEEWLCPSCGRRFLMRWPPNYERLVLDPGDESATHVGGKGGVRVGQVTVRPVATQEPETTERNWLRSHGVDWDGPTA